jgi:hypothetical protein
MANGQPGTIPESAFAQKIVDAMIDVLQKATSPEMMQVQLILAQRLALAGSVIPSRVQEPQNITEIGGYLNLLDELQAPELRGQVLASILGVAGPNPPEGWLPSAPVLFFGNRDNDRPTEGGQQAAIALQFSMRSDFVLAFDAALKAIHDRGGRLPILTPVRTLPPATTATPPPDDLLVFVGRTLHLVPSVALAGPDTDVLAVARLTAEAVGQERVVARVLDSAAPAAPSVTPQNWTAWKRDPATSAFVEDAGGGPRAYIDLNPILNAAGWYRLRPIDTAALGKPESWARFENVTGLVSGVTTFGDEVRLLYTPGQIAASALRERLTWIWNGTAFAAPT